MLISALHGDDLVELLDNSLQPGDCFLLLDKVMKKAFDPSEAVSQ